MALQGNAACHFYTNSRGYVSLRTVWMTQPCPVRQECGDTDTGQGADRPLQMGGAPAASSSASASVATEPPHPQLGLELLSSTSFFSQWCRQLALLKMSVLAFIRALAKHSPPPFVLHGPRGGKIYYEHHFTQTSQTCWDSTIHEATTWILLTTQESRKTKTSPPSCYQVLAGY